MMRRPPTLQCTGPARKAAQAGDFERSASLIPTAIADEITT